MSERFQFDPNTHYWAAVCDFMPGYQAVVKGPNGNVSYCVTRQEADEMAERLHLYAESLKHKEADR